MTRDRFDTTLPRAQKRLDALIALYATIGIPVRPPALHGFSPGYNANEGNGVQMTYLAHGSDGKILMNREMRFGDAELLGAIAHELSHAALDQRHRSWCEPRSWSGHPEHWPFRVLDEGLAEHLRVACLAAVARETGRPCYAVQAIAEFAHFRQPLRSLSRKPAQYHLGYDHVRRLRAHSVALPRIFEKPWHFLPTN